MNYQTNITLFEHMDSYKLNDQCRVWSWDRSLRFNATFFRDDWVHCTTARQKKVVRYLTAAALAGVRRCRYAPGPSCQLRVIDNYVEIRFMRTMLVRHGTAHINRFGFKLDYNQDLCWCDVRE